MTLHKLALVLAASLFGTQAFAAACAKDGSGAITGDFAAGWCNTQSDYYTLTLYKVGMCTAAPVAPADANTAANLSSCVTVFENAAGSEITIVGSSAAPAPSGTFTRPPNGTYTHAYVAISPTLKLKTQMTFSTARTGAAGGNGTKCWTKDVTYYFRNGGGANPYPANATDCGNTVTGQGTTTTVVNTMGNTGDVAATYSLTFDVAGKAVSMYLVTPDYKLGSGVVANTLGTIERVLVVSALSGATVTDATSGIGVAINTTEGAGPEFGGGSTTPMITVGPLLPNISVY